VRLDLFLKTSRLVKRRTAAREMCDAGRVLVNGHQARPSKELKLGDFVALRFPTKDLELEILTLLDRKAVQALDVSTLYRIVQKNK
jgi:ribosomal 50S subunit-recycling heat shock protein